ncbi:MAG: hemerythrin domain-containing protein [Betaproteobacteria bacterium]
MKKSGLQYPDWLYRALPYIYMLVGLLVMVPLPGWLTMFSGLTLFAAGVTVWVHRYRYRKAFNASNGHIDVLDWSDGDSPKGGHMQISWRSSFECGHPILDAQHRRLFGMGSDLVNAVLSKMPKAEKMLLVDAFVDQMIEHFETEQAVLASRKKARFVQHQEEHRTLIAKAENVRNRYHHDDIRERELVAFVTYDIIVKHVLQEELKLAGVGTTAKMSKRAAKRNSGARPGTSKGGPKTGSAPESEPDSVWGETYFR